MEKSDWEEEVIELLDSEIEDESINIDNSLTDRNLNNDTGCCSGTDKQLLVSKLFYLFFFSAFGCVTPYLALYFKQIFISPRQLGIIISVRSFVQFIFAPILSALAERYNKRLLVILFAILSYTACYVTLPFIPSDEKPPACRPKATPKQDSDDIPLNTSTPLSSFSKLNEISMSVNPPRSDEGEDYYYLPWSLFYTPPVDKKKSERNHKSVKLSVTDVNKHLSNTSPLYLSILLVVILGYIFGSPAQTLADIATLQSLGSGRTHEYGRQALFGSVGYGLVSFIVGASVSELKTRNPCSGSMDTNYLPCFICFGVLMIICFFVSTGFRFRVGEKDYSKKTESSSDTQSKCKVTFESIVFIIVVFFCGSASGFIGTFLLWHIHELGGPQLLFSFVSLFNSSAEVLIYHVSHRLVTALGYCRVIYLGLICYGIRFFYYSYCEKPWLFLPIELIHGITSAAVWSAFVYYVSNDAGNTTTLQGVVSGVYGGLGYAAGGLVGGILVHELGTSAAFLMFGEACLVVLCLFIMTNIIGEKRSKETVSPTSETDKEKKENKD